MFAQQRLSKIYISGSNKIIHKIKAPEGACRLKDKQTNVCDNRFPGNRWILFSQCQLRESK